MSVLSRVLLVFIAAALLAGAWITVEESAVIREKSRLIARNETLIDSLRTEKSKLQDRITEVGREMAALPDSLRKLRTGYAVKESQKIAKQEMIYDNRISRNRKIKKVREGARDAVARRLLLWDGILAGAVVLFGGALFMTRKRVGRPVGGG